jgi:hypothetical protein
LQRLHEDEEYTHNSHWIEDKISISKIELGRPIAKLGPAHLFGEVALVENRSRSATVVCSADSEFLCINRIDFDSLLKKTIQETHMALPGLVEPLLKHIPFFENFRPTVLENIAYCMRHHVEPQGKVLFWEGEPPGCCYLILSGTVGVWKRSGDEKHNMALHGAIETYMASPDVCARCDEVAEGLAATDKPQDFTTAVLRAAAEAKQKKGIGWSRKAAIVDKI